MGDARELKRSLDRLKALDTLPDIESQLAEIDQLCTHPARAEMIAKWMLEKCKTSDDHNENAAIWEALLSAFRLLSPARLAQLLLPHTFLSTLDSVLASKGSSTVPLVAIGKLLSFLFDSVKDPQKAQIRAGLCLPAVRAASLAGHLVRLVSLESLSQTAVPLELHTVLRLAFSIWDARRPSNDENLLFAQHILDSTAILLCLCPDTPDRPWTSMKRARGEDTSKDNGISIRSMLEHLLAKHIFLPARNVFFLAYDQNARSDVPTSGPHLRQSTISELLEPLKRGLSPGNVGQRTLRLALPRLLDIALRAVKIPTPRQRRREHPWIEKMFNALLDCNEAAEGEPVNRFEPQLVEVVTEMLKKLTHTGSLSSELLTDIVKLYTVLDDDHDLSDSVLRADSFDITQWKLIAQVADMNAHVFCKSPMVDTLFSCLTDAAHELQEYDSASDEQAGRNANTENMRRLWLDAIVAKVMYAFARNRDFQRFIDLWCSNLKIDTDNRGWSIWTHLSDIAQPMIEEALTKTEIKHRIKSLSGNIIETARTLAPDQTFSDTSDSDSKHKPLGRTTTADSAPPMELGSHIVVLDALVGGITSESLLEDVAETCEKLFEALLVLPLGFSSAPQDMAIGQFGRMWSLIVKTLEIWVPAWVARQSDSSSIVKRVRKWTQSEAHRQALRLESFLQTSSTCEPSSVRDAEYFYFLILWMLAPYAQELKDDFWSTLDIFIDDIAHDLEIARARAYWLYRHFGQEMNKRPVFDRILEHYLRKADIASALTDNTYEPFENVRKLAAGSVAFKCTGMVKAFVEATIHAIRTSNDPAQEYEVSPTARGSESVLIEVVTSVIADSLGREDRESLLNAFEPSDVTGFAGSNELVEKRLALMIKLMERPNATAKIATDASFIWRLARTVAEAGVDSIHFTAKVLELSQELGSLLIKQALATQNQERSRNFLMLQSELVVNAFEQPERPAVVALSTTILRELETGAKPDLLAQLPHRNYDLVDASVGYENYWNFTLNLLQGPIYDEFSAPFSLLNIDVYSDMLCEVFKIGSTTFQSRNTDRFRKLVGSIAEVLDNEGTATCYSAGLIRLFAMACRADTSAGTLKLHATRLTGAITRTLDSGIPPRDIEILSMCFHDFFKTLDGASKAKIIIRLSATGNASLESRLLLLSQCISEISKGDFAHPLGSTAYQLLPRLLDVAASGHSVLAHQRVTLCIITLLKEKPFMVNQHSVELTLQTITKSLDAKTGLSLIFNNACRLISTLLSSHRPRLHGRMHLTNTVFEKLISVLFHFSTSSTTPQSRVNKSLNPKHAHALSRLLVVFCEPTNLHSSKSSTLVDESRKEQAYVGQFVQHILHHYCKQVLEVGALGKQVREGLMPGIWAMIDAIRTGGEDGMKSLSASMNNNERAILRGVYEDWKRFGKWRGG